jgi:hypothetical protein
MPAAPWMGSIMNAAILEPSASRAAFKPSMTPKLTTMPEGLVGPTEGTKGPYTVSY